MVVGSDNMLPFTELYDPASNSWSGSGSLTSGRLYQTAALLSNGKLLAAVTDVLAGKCHVSPRVVRSLVKSEDNRDAHRPLYKDKTV